MGSDSRVGVKEEAVEFGRGGELDTWTRRDVSGEKIVYMFVDGWYPRVRIGKKRVRVPVLVTLGTCADGRRVILDLRIAGEESEASWTEVVHSLIERDV